MRLFSRSRVVLLLLALLLLGLHALGWLGPVEGIVIRTLAPAQRTFSRWLPARHPATLAPLLESLQQENARLLIENAKLKDTLAERAANQQQKDFLAQENFLGVQAHVLGRSTDAGEETLVLDTGKEASITAGQAVVTGDGVLVGTILSSESHRSTVLPITSSRTQIGASAQNQTQSQGLVSGEHSLALLMRFIPQNEKVGVGETVVTSNIDEKIPANLLIGKVTEVRFQAGDLFQEATLQSLADITHARFVSVITGKQ